MKILIVDDEVALAENVAKALTAAGYQADVATSAEEALAHLKIDGDGADVLLTDYRLPGATGAELIRAVRSLGYRIPALVITAYQDDDIAKSAISAGAADVLTKPVDFRSGIGDSVERKNQIVEINEAGQRHHVADVVEPRRPSTSERSSTARRSLRG